MSKPGRAIVGSLFFMAGLVGLFAGTQFVFSVDDRYGIIMISCMGCIGGLHLLLQGFGVTLFPQNRDNGSGGFFSEGGHGDGGD
jgi:hypothetical protein